VNEGTFQHGVYNLRNNELLTFNLLETSLGISKNINLDNREFCQALLLISLKRKLNFVMIKVDQNYLYNQKYN